MGTVSFTARRSMLLGRVAGEVVTFSVDFADMVRRRSVRKYPHRASDGKLETVYEGADTIWELEFAPAVGDLFARIREFVDSTASGEPFQVWPYGTEAAPITLRRADQGYTPSTFMQAGRDDYRVLRITGIEQ